MFYKNKKVLITGHTGFKGAWMCKVLSQMGANVLGYSLEADEISLFNLIDASNIRTVIGDIRDLNHLQKTFDEFQPEIVIHMAAQPLVRESYDNPVYTYETNVMGTVNILECVRHSNSVKSFVNVTTDKVYLNREWPWGYRENEELNGYDPYSNSKSCSELVTSSYINSFFSNDDSKSITTCRAGNVIGGGDFAKDRIIPDCVRAIQNNQNVTIRNPNSTRPYQHVLEPVMAYLMIAKEQYDNKSLASSYNIGPDDCDCLTTGKLVELFCEAWNKTSEQKIEWMCVKNNGPHEANFLKLDCTKAKQMFSWEPVWHIKQAIDKIVEWTKVYLNNEDINTVMDKQVSEYLLAFKKNFD